MSLTAAIIKSKRESIGLTQVEVAVRVGVSLPAYRLWEYGGTKPTAANRVKLLEVLGLGGATHDDRAEKSN